MTDKQKMEKEIEKHGYEPSIACDLDGTLAEWTEWGNPIGKPVHKMLTRVYKWKAAGKKIKIFTARITGKNGETRKDQIKEIRAWLEPLGLEDLEITNIKDNGMTEFWDDKAISVEKNTGERSDGKYQRD